MMEATATKTVGKGSDVGLVDGFGVDERLGAGVFSWMSAVLSLIVLTEFSKYVFMFSVFCVIRFWLTVLFVQGATVPKRTTP